MTDQHAGSWDTYDLVAKARAKFGKLSECEEKIVRAAQKGEVAYRGPSERDDDPANDPAKAAEWGEERVARAWLLRWLCVDPQACKHIDPRGIQVHAANISGRLDLSFATVPFPLLLMKCRFAAPLGLMSAKIPGLNLEGTRIPGLLGDGVQLRKGFHADGEVRLLDADIGGDLECDGGTFANKGGDALSADGIQVRGAVFLHGGFSVEGEVSLAGADIGGQLVIGGAQFSDGSGLEAQGAKVKGEFFWRDLGPNSPARLGLSHAWVGTMGDDEQSWPRKGNLDIDGFVYEQIGLGPTDAKGRLEWLARQPDGFIPQPFQQLAKVLGERGDDGVPAKF